MAARTSKKRQSIAEIRIQKDMQEIGELQDCKIRFPNPDTVLQFIVTVNPQDGIWKGGVFEFSFKIPDDYPFSRPEVRCLTRVWHPNIEETGAVCLNILREGFTPAVTVEQMAVGLLFLFNCPDPHSPLNNDAAQQYIDNIEAFTIKAREYVQLYCRH